jgi:predicted O-methyltransferase YrrM
MIPYIGDLSKADAKILKELATVSTRILEFGVGGSTQILAAYGLGTLTTIETSLEWTERTKENLKLLGIEKEVVFLEYNDFIPEGEYDLIFDDGADEFRLPFAFNTWNHLSVGGFMLFHDTRRGKDVQNIADFIVKHSPEIESVFINKDHSNITVINKKKAEFYENWNEVEGREPWESGYEPVNVEKLKDKITNTMLLDDWWLKEVQKPMVLSKQEIEMYGDMFVIQLRSMVETYNRIDESEILARKYHDYRMAIETIYPNAPVGMGINEFAEWIKK